MTTYTIIKEEPSGATDAMATKVEKADVDDLVETYQQENEGCKVYKVEERD